MKFSILIVGRRLDTGKPVPLRKLAEPGLVEKGTGAQCETDDNHQERTECDIQSFPHILPVQAMMLTRLGFTVMQ